MPGPRIAVIGTTGSGKTTVAARLAQALGIPHIELDALYWKPGWVMTRLEVFRQQVTRVASGPAWVIDGNYGKVRDLIWPRATTLVWLDYPLPVVLWQLGRRTLARIMHREVLWNGNRETVRGAFFSRDSILLWALRTYWRHRAEYARLLSLPDQAHLQVILLRSPRDCKRWLRLVENHPV